MEMLIHDFTMIQSIKNKLFAPFSTPFSSMIALEKVIQIHSIDARQNGV
jgi:hypothetical protein